MRNYLGLATLLAAVEAQETFGAATRNECWLDEGAEWKKCSDIFYRHCDEYLLYPESSCNVFIFSQSELKWFSPDIRAVYWTYFDQTVQTDGAEDGEEESINDDFGDFKAKLKQESVFNNKDEECELSSSIPEAYEQSKRIGMIGSTCGYKFQIRNFNKYTDMTFKVVRDSSVALAASAALLASALAF